MSGFGDFRCGLALERRGWRGPFLQQSCRHRGHPENCLGYLNGNLLEMGFSVAHRSLCCDCAQRSSLHVIRGKSSLCLHLHANVANVRGTRMALTGPSQFLLRPRRPERVGLCLPISVDRGVTSMIAIRSVTYTFAIGEAQLENEPSGISFQDTELGGCSSFAKWQTQSNRFADSARPRPTQGRRSPSRAFARTGRHQGKRSFRFEPRYSKRQTECRDGHGREFLVRVERKHTVGNADIRTCAAARAPVIILEYAAPGRLIDRAACVFVPVRYFLFASSPTAFDRTAVHAYGPGPVSLLEPGASGFLEGRQNSPQSLV